MIHHVDQYDRSEPKAGKINGYLIFICVCIFAIFMLTVYYFYASVSAEKRDKQAVSGVSYERQVLHTYELKTLTTLSWENKKKKVVHLPIDLAIDAVVKSYRSK